jgi:hypothetical protein
MITNQALTNQSQPGSGQEPTNTQRRAFIGGALATLLSSSGRVMAEETDVPNNPFILLLHGLYHPVVHGPKLGLSSVNLDDGSYSTTKIYPVFGVSDSKNEDKQDDGAIGNFYVSLKTGLCAYQLPGGAIAMQFTSGGFPMIIPDGKGGQYDEGTFELTILEATGIYSGFKGGHNHMVDRIHQLVAGPPFAGFPSSGYDEFCFCIISQYPFP